MRKGVAAEIFDGYFMLAAQNFSLVHFLKFKYHGNFTYIAQIVHSNAHLNPFKIFSVTTHS